MIKHEGRSTHRFDDNPLERVFADEWKEMNDGEGRGHGILAYLLAENPNRPRNEVSDRDAEVAATVIQWLGSNVGQCFLSRANDVIREAHLDQK